MKKANKFLGIFTGALSALLIAGSALAQTSDFITFESGSVEPIALTPDGTKLLVVNTPGDHLEIYDVSGTGLTHAASVSVGLEPVTVAVRNNDEAWVANLLSDSVSIVDLSSSPPQVTRTLLVGDEPRDIRFADLLTDRAFVTTAHRGQQRTDPSIGLVPGAGDPQFLTPGIGRADVWVFNANSPGTGVGGTPLEILSFFADTPRALAVSKDRATVYVAAFHSGNQTTAILETAVCNGFAVAPPCNTGGGDIAPGGLPSPSDNVFGAPAPEVGLIVKFDRATSQWTDELHRNWNPIVKSSQPDLDVFAFNADTLAPAAVPNFPHVGTTLLNMAFNPVSGQLYVTNTDARNEVRFEGPGLHGGTTVRGHAVETRITVIDPVSGTVSPKHLNKHVPFGSPSPAAEAAAKPHSLSNVRQMAISSDGLKIYAAAMGSDKIAVFDAADIEDPNFDTNFDPTVESAQYIPVEGGPAGVVLDEAQQRLYATTRFDNSVVSIPLAGGAQDRITMHNPEPPGVVLGRPFLYDADFSSSNGTSACSDCHIDGDLDDLGWDLGDPDAPVTVNPQPAVPGSAPAGTFHPMKGPMTTQTLRGLRFNGGQHWRGDRTDGFFGLDPCNRPAGEGAPCNAELSFNNFIVAFEGLLGRHSLPTPAEMQLFTTFALEIIEPPNPQRSFDLGLTGMTPDQRAGALIFLGATGATDGIGTCDACHDLDASRGLFGTGGLQTFEGETQNFKVPHLRNQYTKVGMFGTNAGLGAPHTGDQIRGFGFLHDGSVDTLVTFFGSPVFALNATEERQVAEAMMIFDTDLASVVGQQVTRTATNASDVDPRIDLLIQAATEPFVSLALGGNVTECDLVVKGTVGGVPQGWFMQPSGIFADDRGGNLSDATLRGLSVTEGPLTYTCQPPGSGQRAGLDRDRDTLLDGYETGTGIFVSATDTGTSPASADTDGDGWMDDEEITQGTDPNDPLSFPNIADLPGLSGFALAALATALAGSGYPRAGRRRRGSLGA